MGPSDAGLRKMTQKSTVMLREFQVGWRRSGGGEGRAWVKAGREGHPRDDYAEEDRWQ